MGQHGGGDVQPGQQLLVPLELKDVVEHGAGGVGVVGDVDPPPGQIPDQPGVNVAEEQLAPLRLCPGSGHMVQNPANLGGGEVGVQHHAAFAADLLRPALGRQLVAELGRAAALPHNGVVHRLAGGLVPDHGGLPLVGNANGGHVPGGGADLQQRLLGHTNLAGPDLHGVVFHPARLGEKLGELLLRHAANAAGLVKQDAAGTGGALVQRHDILRHMASPPPVIGLVVSIIMSAA